MAQELNGKRRKFDASYMAKGNSNNCLSFI